MFGINKGTAGTILKHLKYYISFVSKLSSFESEGLSSRSAGPSRCVCKNSTIVSVSHLVMDSVSATDPSSSISLICGIWPPTYFTWRFGNFPGRSLFTKAWTWGKPPNFHPHTSRRAFEYFLTVFSSGPGSSVLQHFRQSVLRNINIFTHNIK